ncbi:NAD(P)-dependent oxidoreductase [Methylophaga sp. OBS3]|uniref:NAD(P)-dependent oxidoreductase n=1 Tax=Methylophaga sp. OBS3 TaxID=2991934 RepID=UPI00224DE028|nr:NAD(P)-dependent oxidoreductase [Methylophaga sp. OBS3]MCX4189502.1 NAD(P)-dependent oxidoreductase [Methylophaga sp. OBS3]
MQIAILGGGLMGQAMTERLLVEQQKVTVFNRSIDKIQALKSLGASVTDNVLEAVNSADLLLLTLSDATAIESVLASIPAEKLAGKLLIQMGTIGPQQSQQIAEKCLVAGTAYLECPVLGSLPEARSGNLILMAGGAHADFEKALPVLRLLGKKPQLIGEVGQGAAMKLAMNQLIAGLTASFSLSLGLIESQGIDTEQFMGLLRESALYAPTFDKKLERMQQRDFANPNFPTKHLTKDTRLFLEVAEQLRLDASGLEGVLKLLDKTVSMGLDNTDYSAIYAAVSPDRK